MRCDECKHWQLTAEDWEADEIGFGICRAVRQRWTITDEATEILLLDKENNDVDQYHDEEFVQARRNALRSAKAYVQDGSQYKAELITGPDFFCALHTSKPL